MKRIKYWTTTGLMLVASLVAIQYIQFRAERHGYAVGFAQGYTHAVRDLDDIERAPLPDAPAVFVRPRKERDI